MIRRIVVAAALLACLLSGCSDQRILERLGFLHTASYDLIPVENKHMEDQLEVSVTYPVIDAQLRKVKYEVFSATAQTSKEAKMKISRKSELSLVNGQLRSTLFGLSIAKKGLWEYIDTLVRDPSISQRVKITVVNGNANELLKKKYPSHQSTGQYIDRMLEKEVRSNNVPEITIYEFARDYFDDGIDVIVPIIKDQGVDIVVDGIALFEGDQYKTKLDAEQAIYFAFLRDSFKQGDISIDLSEVGLRGEYIFSTLSSKRELNVKRDSSGAREVEIAVDIRGSVLEYTGDLQLSDHEEKERLEKLVSHYISRKLNAIIKKMQKYKVDSIGVGKHVRNSMTYSDWIKLDWNRLYPQTKIQTNVHVTIKDYGKFER
ncbi:Ger(x)C family spore germination protein [Paenibacillus sp. 1011MAR3C5]|uniref:Ger(x)C family spore germination protein n=1 Tax=Paenibacillus sp. 1011MAR3C5 TaxID=1675787 RepID=UPI000E6B6180|nr:Ger(x)C family spore germination protein [Paenibacillus sp. 1011MAR3C5]RJE89737.1 Ger(x)C family spore germination protein [Paenibacillus sp. 1011MAR3C5]